MPVRLPKGGGTEYHYAFKPSPCLKRVELPLNEQIFSTIGISKKAKPVHVLPSVKFPLNTVHKNNKPAHGKLRLLKYPINITKGLTISN